MKSWISCQSAVSLLVGCNVAVLTLVFPFSATAQRALSLEGLLGEAQKNSEIFQSYEQTLQAYEEDLKSRDLELSTTLTAELGRLVNRKETFNVNPNYDSTFLNTTLTKPFSTGTTASLLLGQQFIDRPITDSQSVTGWDIRLSQDLWRNAFGRSTRLRRDYDRAEFNARRFQVELDKQNFLIELENLYWDLSLGLREEKIHLDNIRRNEDLKKWIQDRVRRSAAEKVDLFQVEALLTDRSLSLIAVQNRIAELRDRLQRIVPGLEAASLNVDLKDIELTRDPTNLLAGPPSPEVPLRLDSLVSRYSTEQAMFASRQVDDQLNPSLAAYVQYGKNGIEPKFSQSSDQATRDNHYATEVGLLLSVELDKNLKDRKRKSALLLAQARELELKAKNRSSLMEWADLKRQITNLTAQAEEVRKLADFQKKKSDEERKRFRLGRSTAFQAITFEVDSSDAELRVYRVLAELRKTEARARLFTSKGSI